jgi:hypothetical protein
MATIETLMEKHTKEKLRERAYSLDVSVPRGATKRDIADLVVLEENSSIVQNGKQLERVAEDGGFVRFDGEWLHVQVTDKRHEAKAWHDGHELVFSGALRGNFAVFRKISDDTMKIASPSSLEVSRRQ